MAVREQSRQLPLETACRLRLPPMAARMFTNTRMVPSLLHTSQRAGAFATLPRMDRLRAAINNSFHLVTRFSSHKDARSNQSLFRLGEHCWIACQDATALGWGHSAERRGRTRSSGPTSGVSNAHLLNVGPIPYVDTFNRKRGRKPKRP